MKKTIFFQTFKIMCMIEPKFLSQAFWKYTKNMN